MRVRARRGGRVASDPLVLVMPYIAVALEGVTPLTNAQQDCNRHRPTQVPKMGTISARESENTRKMRRVKYGSAGFSPAHHNGIHVEAGKHPTTPEREMRDPRERNGTAHTYTDTATNSFRHSQRAGQYHTPQGDAPACTRVLVQRSRVGNRMHPE